MSPESWPEPAYDADRMRAIDRWAIEKKGVPSLDLMEAAGSATARAAGEVARSARVGVVCGKGNNAGDGLVAARVLAETGYEVDVLLLWPPEQGLSGDAEANLERFPGRARHVGGDELRDALAGCGVVIDAIFGTGFRGAPGAPANGGIEALNACDAPVVAADIASGVDASSGEVSGAAVRASVSVSFHASKLGHWIAPGKQHAGEVRVAEIGIPPGAPIDSPAALIGTEALSVAPRRGAESTKFSSGQVLIVGGSRGLTGAVCMSSEAAIRAGAGYATVAVPRELEQIFEVKLTEVMSRGCPGPEGSLGPDAAEEILAAAERAASVVLGPGLGRSDPAFELARSLVSTIEAPLLVDADGLNSLAGRLELVAGRRAPTVLTPHAGELARLLESDSGNVAAHRLRDAREASARCGAVVVLKGDDTLVVDGERLGINRISSPALATAGTGDVLSGVIAALIARGLEPFEAACAGVLAHARAGRIAAQRVNTESVIATDVIGALPAGLAA